MTEEEEIANMFQVQKTKHLIWIFVVLAVIIFIGIIAFIWYYQFQFNSFWDPICSAVLPCPWKLEIVKGKPI